MANVSLATTTDILDGTGATTSTTNTSAGDDTITIQNQNRLNATDRLDGGDGIDTIKLTNSGNYDFTGLAAFTRIENIATNGNGSKTVKLTSAQAAGLASIDMAGNGVDTLRIVGVAGSLDLTGLSLTNIDNGSITGGATDDTLTITSAQAAYIDQIDLDGGTDTVTVRHINGAAFNVTGTNVMNVENVVLEDTAGATTITGGAASETINAGAGGDTVNAGNGDDVITGGAGDDNIDGQGHINGDTAVYSGNRADYLITLAAGVYTVVHRNGGADGTDTVTNVENFRFSDGTYTGGQLDYTPPTVSSAAAASFAENAIGVAYTATADEAATFALGGADAALFNIDPLTGAVTFITPPDFEGAHAPTYSITITATDAQGNASAPFAVTITVTDQDEAPDVAAPIPDQSSPEEALWTYVVPPGTFDAVDAGDVLTLTATLAGGAALPDWLVFDALAGSFAGTPPADFEGFLDITVTATDGADNVASDTFRLTITGVDDAPRLLNALADHTYAPETPVSVTIPANTFDPVDANDPVTLSAALSNDDPLPSWLIFDPGLGTFTGTPPFGVYGVFDITVTATDGAGNSVSDTFFIEVMRGDVAPVVAAPIAGQSSPEDTPWNFLVPVGTFTDGNGDAMTLTATLANGDQLPLWLFFDGTSFTGTPPLDFNGTIDIMVTATDTTNMSASTTFTLTVTPIDDAPTGLTLTGVGGIIIDDAASLVPVIEHTIVQLGTLSALDPDTSGLVFTTTTPGFQIRNGVELWIAHQAVADFERDAAGSVTVTVLVSDGVSDPVPRTYTLDIANAVRDIATRTSAGDDLIIGGASLDYLRGLGGNDILRGAGGNDRLMGGAGADQIFGDAGVDIADFRGALASVVVNLETGGTGGDAAGDTYESIERVYGSSHNDDITGDILAEGLFGAVGDDTLNGNLGNDFLVGGLGADAMDGGLGNDIVSYYYATAGVALHLETGGTGGEALGDTYANLERVIGSQHVDNIAGGLANDSFFGLGSDDTLDGGEGHDVLEGGLGADTLIGGLGVDTASYSLSRTAVTVDLGTGGTAGDATGDTYSGIERVFGSRLGDTITGTDANEKLYGLGGVDILDGGLGSDTLFGGAGGDFFVFNDSNLKSHIADWQNGSDKIDLTAFASQGVIGIGNITIDAVGADALVTVAGTRINVVGAAGQIEATDFLFGAIG